MERFQKIIMTLLMPTNLAVLGLIIYSINIMIDFAPVNFDAGYYLIAVRKVLDAKIPYTDFSFLYTPLSLAFFAISALVGGAHNEYRPYLIIIFVAEILFIVVFYFILTSLGVKKRISLFSALILSCEILNYEGAFIVLEPFIILPTLLSLLLMFRFPDSSATWIISGVLAFVSFLSKQYGILAFGPVLAGALLLAQSKKSGPKNVALALITGVIFVVIFMGIFHWINNFDMGGTVRSLSGPHLVSRVDVRNISIFFLSSGFLFLVPIYLKYPIKEKYRNAIIILTVGFLCFSLPLLIKQHLHYFLLVLPFSIGLGALVLDLTYSCKYIPNYLRVFSNVVILLFFIGAVFRLSQYTDYIVVTNPRLRQLEIGERITKLVPPFSKAVIAGDAALFFICQLDPSDDLMRTHLPSLNTEQQQVAILDSEYFIAQRGSAELNAVVNSYDKGSVMFWPWLQTNFYQIGIVDSFIIWKRIPGVK